MAWTVVPPLTSLCGAAILQASTAIAVLEALEDNMQDDPEWQRLSKQRDDHADARMWGRYRNDTLSMADFLRRQGRLEEALVSFLELCYLDLNGPQNPGKYPDLGLPNFDPARSYGLAPGVIQRIQIAAKALGYDEARTQVEFKKEVNVLVNADILKLYTENSDFAVFLTQFIEGKPFWLNL
jgi:hypothetical protein